MHWGFWIYRWDSCRRKRVEKRPSAVSSESWEADRYPSKVADRRGKAHESKRTRFQKEKCHWIRNGK